MDAPSGGAPEQAPRWDLVDTESCGGGIRFLAPVLIVRGYVGIYRRKEYVGGASGGPRARGHALQGGLLSRGGSGCFLTCTPSSPDLVRSKNHVPEGFIPIGLRSIFFSCETLKQGKNRNWHWALG